MVDPRLKPAVARAREQLVRLATGSARTRRVMARAGAELSRAVRIADAVSEARAVTAAHRLDADLYGGSYFGVGRDPGGDREGHSGYATYDRISSNADIAAACIWRHFSLRRTLDVGCAQGFLVEALRERNVEAFGCDVSAYAVEHAAPGALGWVRIGDLARGLPYDDGEFELVSALEILEHVEPESVPGALAELRRVCGGILVATIPSIGQNPSGPHGHLEGKVRPERLEHYRSLADAFDGPVEREDLMLDADGHPIEGHLTIASYRWWTARFADAGFDRWADVEQRIYADIAPVGLDAYWNLYVFAVPGTPVETATPKTPGASLPELGLVHPLYEHAAAEARRTSSDDG